MNSSFDIELIIASMLDYTLQHLKLEDVRVEEVTPHSKTFLGYSNRHAAKPRKFALEVITDETLFEGKAPVKVFNGLIKERSSPKSRANKTYTAFLFPRTPNFCRQFDIPDQIRIDAGLAEMYEDFDRTNIKFLGRVEREVSLKVSASQIAYFNSSSKLIEIYEFQSFPCNGIIPVDRPPDQDYVWDNVRRGEFPNGFSRGAEVFRGIEQGAHNRIKRIIRTQKLIDDFSLVDYIRPGGIAGARFESLDEPLLFDKR